MKLERNDSFTCFPNIFRPSKAPAAFPFLVLTNIAMPDIEVTVESWWFAVFSKENYIYNLITHIYHSFSSHQLRYIIKCYLDHVDCSTLPSGELDKIHFWTEIKREYGHKKTMGFSIFQWVSFSLMPCLSLNALIPTWVTNVGRNGKTDVKSLFPHLHAVCHGQFNPRQLERPCFCRTASLCTALKACKVKGSQIFSALPAMCLMITHHIITSIRLKVSPYSWETEKLSLPVGVCTFISVFFERVSAGWLQFKTKENETPIILEENFFFFFLSFQLLFLLINSALWL